MIARGGKAVYGAALGILMLQARFPRIPGDMGNALTWPFPVLYKVVRGASPTHESLNRATSPSASCPHRSSFPKSCRGAERYRR